MNYFESSSFHQTDRFNIAREAKTRLKRIRCPLILFMKLMDYIYIYIMEKYAIHVKNDGRFIVTAYYLFE